MVKRYRLIQSTGKHSRPMIVLTRWFVGKAMLVDLKEYLNRNDDIHLYLVDETEI